MKHVGSGAAKGASVCVTGNGTVTVDCTTPRFTIRCAATVALVALDELVAPSALGMPSQVTYGTGSPVAAGSVMLKVMVEVVVWTLMWAESHAVDATDQDDQDEEHADASAGLVAFWAVAKVEEGLEVVVLLKLVIFTADTASNRLDSKSKSNMSTESSDECARNGIGDSNWA